MLKPSIYLAKMNKMYLMACLEDYTRSTPITYYNMALRILLATTLRPLVFAGTIGHQYNSWLLRAAVVKKQSYLSTGNQGCLLTSDHIVLGNRYVAHSSTANKLPCKCALYISDDYQGRYTFPQCDLLHIIMSGLEIENAISIV